MNAPEMRQQSRSFEEAMANLREGMERVRAALEQGRELRAQLNRLEYRADFLLRNRPPSSPPPLG